MISPASTCLACDHPRSEHGRLGCTVRHDVARCSCVARFPNELTSAVDGVLAAFADHGDNLTGLTAAQLDALDRLGDAAGLTPGRSPLPRRWIRTGLGAGDLGWCGDPAPHEDHHTDSATTCPGVSGVRAVVSPDLLPVDSARRVSMNAEGHYVRTVAPMTELEIRARDGDR